MKSHPTWLLAACLAVLAACSGTEPGAPSIVGEWQLAGFSDSGTAGVTTGTMTFTPAGNWSVLGTVTYPGEPTDSLTGGGTYAQDGYVLTMSPTGGPSRIWDLAFAGNQAVITGRPPVYSVITLTRP